MDFKEEIAEIRKLAINFDYDKIVSKIIQVSEKHGGNDRFLIVRALVSLCVSEGKMQGVEELKNKISKDIDDISSNMLIGYEF